MLDKDVRAGKSGGLHMTYDLLLCNTENTLERSSSTA